MESLFLSGVEVDSQLPIAGGGFGDVYKGTRNMERVALKVSKFYTTASPEEIEEIIHVRPSTISSPCCDVI